MLNPDGHVYVENNNVDSVVAVVAQEPTTERRRDGRRGSESKLRLRVGPRRRRVRRRIRASLVYRGPAPFSEPETAALQAFIESRNFSMVLSFHSFAEVLIYPWAYDLLYTVDHELYRALGAAPHRRRTVT